MKGTVKISLQEYQSLLKKIELLSNKSQLAKDLDKYIKENAAMQKYQQELIRNNMSLEGELSAVKKQLENIKRMWWYGFFNKKRNHG